MSKVFLITEGLENLGALRTGGQGSVYKGRRQGPIITAVKLLPTPIHTEDPTDKNFRKFQNEVEKLKKVNERPSPNVVTILSSGLTESGSFPYIEMEFIEGPDLEELLAPPNDPIFGIKQVLKLADQLANALAHCHAVGVKHGDVKSNNVKYNVRTGNYVLLDFGLAVMTDEQRRTSIRHAGAIEFMAPEQNTGAMLPQTDIYSFGIILYEMLAGQVPFPLNDGGETARNSVMIAHMESPVPDPVELRKKNLPATWTAEKKAAEMRVPLWLLQIISTCLEKDPAKRYADGLALREALYLASVERENFAAAAQSLEALKTQNAVLTAQVNDLRAKQNNSGLFVRIPKRIALAVLLSVIALMALGSYGVLKKPRVVIKHDTIVRTRIRHDTIFKYVHIVGRDTTGIDQNPNKPKKRRKKFLGLF